MIKKFLCLFLVCLFAFPVWASDAIRPFSPVKECGLTELVGINEQVDQGEIGASVGIAVPDIPENRASDPSGEILSVTLYLTEDGTGTLFAADGTLIILDADPASSAGDASLSAAEAVTVLALVPVVDADWLANATGYIANKIVAIPFHTGTTLYFVWFHQDATSLNDVAGDDFQLEMNCWYRRDS